MSLESLGANWDEFGRVDPMWAVLTDNRKRGGGWNPDEFFETGRLFVKDCFDLLDRLGVTIGRRRCLDFGCGLGRLSQALAERFDHCDGVDIAPSMIDGANRRNRHGERCVYHLNTEGDLRLFEDGSFDLVFCFLVLQHMDPLLAKGYLRELLRVLAPGGAAMFQVPCAWSPPPPLRPEDRRATIGLRGPAPDLRAGEPARVSLSIRNEGGATWPNFETSSLPVRAANHWRTPGGELIVRDDGRAELPGDLGPGEGTEIELDVQAPGRPGPWILEVDLVEEGQGWFADSGSLPLQIPVTVRGPSPAQRLLTGSRRLTKQARSARRAGRSPAHSDGARLTSEPIMEMNVIPQDEIAEIVEAAGASLIDATVDGRPGGWVSIRYVAIRPGSSNEQRVVDGRPVT